MARPHRPRRGRSFNKRLRLQTFVVYGSQVPDPRQRPGACVECGRKDRPHVLGCPLDPVRRERRS